MGYTNSPLVVYTKKSPNHSGQRTHCIDTITPHCVVGQCSIEALGEVFAKPSRQASSNYGIGTDGRVGLFVDEANRSWCSSSNANDQRAITIECASDNFAPYAFKDVVYNRLVELCADICKRNGKDTIVWITDKNQRKAYEPKSNEMKFTWHCDWAATNCVPTYTEVLTRNGWKRIDEVEIGEEIACADLDNLNITFEEVYDKVPEREQDTYTANEITATKDHRMIYKISSNPEWRIDYYRNLLSEKNNYYIPLAGTQRSKGINLSDDMIKFYIAVQADGHYMYETLSDGSRSYYGLEFHVKKERKIERIKEILESVNLSYNENSKSDGTVSIRVYNNDDVNMVKDICEGEYLKNKAFTWKWLEMSSEQANLFLSEIMLWDGCIAGKKYTSTIKENLDIVNAICALNNIGSRVIGNDVMFRDAPYVTIGKGCEVKRNHRESHGRKTLVSCVSVKTGVFLARQDGKTFITGNCPGDWLKGRMQDLTNKVNALLKGSTPTPTPEPTPQPQPQPTPVPVPQPQTDEEVIWYYLLAKIQNPYGVAGLMGNLYAESGLRSNNLQNTYERSLGMTDVQYTAAVDNGTYGNFIHDSAGYGLAQWTFWSRKQGMLNFIRGKKKSIGDLNAQLDFLWQELSTGYKGVLAVLTSAKSVRQASDAVLTQFERPADQSENMKQKRASYGQVYYDRYAGSNPAPSPAPQPTPTPSPTPSGVPYIVRITANVLNVRSGPGTNYPVVRTVKKGEAYTIVDVQNGNWGKLKSGVGWICLDYTERVR